VKLCPAVRRAVASQPAVCAAAHALQPTWSIPTLLATRCNDAHASLHGPSGMAARARGQLGDLDVCIGEEALNNAQNPSYSLTAPLRQAVVRWWCGNAAEECSRG
jgi:hypothetical protein